MNLQRLTIGGTEALDQRSQNPLYFIRLACKLPKLFLCQVFKIASQQDVILGFTGGSTSYLQETGKSRYLSACPILPRNSPQSTRRSGAADLARTALREEMPE
jgi:hypothetical protein